ncbi:MAG: GH3 auxin-responsive promoter family protein, partial [Dysgonamonadaceae bacterium]|nr:GH3 auxin-responsive promoter family protein [Dysgonamonadaceae bacterium]
MIIEKTILSFFRFRLESIETFSQYPESVQNKQLTDLIRAAYRTEWGRKYDYASMRSYADFASRVPVQDYEDIKKDIQRMMQGTPDILW